MFETLGWPDEPLTGNTDDPSNYGYTDHIHTKDLVIADYYRFERCLMN